MCEDCESGWIYDLIRDLFLAGCATCALWALHRMGAGVMLSGRVKALRKFEDAYTPEEREVLIRRIKVQSLKY